MKKYLKYTPHIIFAFFMLIMGSKGKLMGAEKAIGLFTKLHLFGQAEYVGRYLIGIAELFAGIGIFFKSVQRYAALLGIILMLGALYFHATMLGINTAGPAVLTLILGIYLFIKSEKCKNDKCLYKKIMKK